MKIAEFRTKSPAELRKMLLEYRERLRQLRFDLAAGKVKNIRMIREVKRDIARILTLLNPKRKNDSSTTNSFGI